MHHRCSSPAASGRARSASPTCGKPALTATARSMAIRVRAPIRWQSFYSHQDQPAFRRALSTPTGCCVPTRRCFGCHGRSCPWSHTFGGNHNLNLALFNGGTIHIDDGRPTRAGGNPFSKTLAALSEVPPTLYFNVPAGYALLAPALESDPALA